MNHDEIIKEIEKYTNLLASTKDDETIKFYKAEIERLKNELYLKKNELENISDMIALYRQELDNEDLDPDKRNFYLSEIQHLEKANTNIEQNPSQKR